jgi:hypothetical protein
MSLVNTLHTLLKQSLPNLHGARLNALMAAVEAGLTGASVSITALERAVSGATFIKHKIKRLGSVDWEFPPQVRALGVIRNPHRIFTEIPALAPDHNRLVAAD